MECVQHRLAPKRLYAQSARKLFFSSLLVDHVEIAASLRELMVQQ